MTTRRDGPSRTRPRPGDVGSLAERLDARLAGVRARAHRRVVHADPDLPENLPLLLRLASQDLDRRLTLALEDEPVSLAEVEVLLRVARRPGGPAELAEYLGRSPQRVCTLVAGLERAGFVEREESWRDARVRDVRPTEAGFALLDAVDDRLAPVVDDVLEGLDDPSRRILALLLGILAVG